MNNTLKWHEVECDNGISYTEVAQVGRLGVLVRTQLYDEKGNSAALVFVPGATLADFGILNDDRR